MPTVRTDTKHKKCPLAGYTMKKRQRFRASLDSNSHSNSPKRDVAFISAIKDRFRLQDVFRPEIRYREEPLLSDNRIFKPATDLHLRDLKGRRIEYKTAKTRRMDKTIAAQAFLEPASVKVCKQRKERRESLFSRGKAGKGKKIRSPRKHTANSSVRC